ncbi:hypothetical protein AAHA92_12700 [Salvia divinorum]|uniref:Uncharacterized protein n=1 Tax=Salvia divinorum TaxID=28513 RepID=A0ABD1HMC7_SALDI
MASPVRHLRAAAVASRGSVAAALGRRVSRGTAAGRDMALVWRWGSGCLGSCFIAPSRSAAAPLRRAKPVSGVQDVVIE